MKKLVLISSILGVVGLGSVFAFSNTSSEENCCNQQAECCEANMSCCNI